MLKIHDLFFRMPYFQATILETHRLANVVPIPIPRVAPKDWVLHGYTIPKDTIIISNHYSVHMDEEYWGDPGTFRPDRFINSNGEFVMDKHVCQFGFGMFNTNLQKKLFNYCNFVLNFSRKTILYRSNAI